jgi:hypothetical protein
MPWTALTATASDPSTTKDSLFQACTAIHLGNGERVRFWGDNWLAGAWPKDIAPDLFALAWRKRLTVAIALRDARWMRGLRRISTTAQIEQFVHLLSLLRGVHLVDRPDDIQWRFTATGTFSTKSAYRVQFHGSSADFEWGQLWSVKAENKCRVFAWLLL